MKVIGSEFFDRNAEVVAPDLLGKYLVRNLNGQILSLKILEVEAYVGQDDLASHARFGETNRNRVMFEKPGVFYVYFIYGMYWMLNVVCGPGKFPSAVLIRGLQGLKGPGVLTKKLLIDKSFSGKLVSKNTNLWFEDRDEVVKKTSIFKTKRIGVNYAGKWADKKLRFVLTD